MSFRTNPSPKPNFRDSFKGLTAREQRAVKGSWAGFFSEYIFPKIDEQPFEVIYSGNVASRPNTPVNVIIGACILKEVFNLTDDEVLENLLLDSRWKYALHTTDFDEQPMSDKTLQRFRRRCEAYAELTGIDLIHECMVSLAEEIAAMMGITGRMKRMDSMMVAANIRNLSRTELLYQCTANLLRRMKRLEVGIPERMTHYLERGDFNARFYRANEDERASVLCEVLGDGAELLKMQLPEVTGSKEYELLKRCFDEQTVEEDGVPRLKTKGEGGMGSSMLQNPSDPDATFREKAGKKHQGYVANFTESVGENGSVVTDYQFEKNNYSDSQFLKDQLGRTEKPDEKTTLVTDGAYDGQENAQLAEEKNVRIVTTALSGSLPEPVLADFRFDETGEKVVSCPAGHAPLKCGSPSKNGQIRLSFNRECCAQCPYRAQCKAKVHKKVSTVIVSRRSCARAKQLEYMETEEFKNLARLRNGAETVPSALRSRYHADRMPVRGLIRSRHMFGFKVGALNVRKFFTYLRSGGHYAQNPALEGC